MRTTRIRLLLTAAIVVVLPLAACGDDDPSLDAGTTSTTTSTTTANANGPAKPSDGPDLSTADWTDLSQETDVEVQARDNVFVKPYIEVKAGSTVTFTNRGRNQHNIIAVPDGAFASIEAEDLEPGSSQTVTFEEAGDYPYYCSLHGTSSKGMVGAIRVLG